MQIWFCQSCGARVTKAELGNVPGLTASTLVYCKDCLKKENRSERAQRKVKVDSGSGRPPSKGVRRKSTRTVSRIVQPEADESGEAEGSDEQELRRHRRGRGSESDGPRAGSKAILIAGITGGVLLIVGVILVSVNFSSEPARPVASEKLALPHETPSPAPAPSKPVVDEKSASDAFDKLNTEISALPAAAKAQKLALIDAYAKKWNESMAGARARTLREKIENAQSKSEEAAAKQPDHRGTDSPAPQMSVSYTPMPSPLTMMETLAKKLAASGDYNQAIKEFDKALALDPKNCDLLLGRADASRMLCDYETCLAYTDRTLEVEPNSWPALAIQGIAAYALSKDTLYKVDMEKALRLCDQGDEYKHTLKAWIEDGAMRGRIVLQGRALENRQPKTGSEFRVRGTCRWLMNQTSEAEADLRRAIELDPAGEGDSTYKVLDEIVTQRHDPKAKVELCREWVKRLPQSSMGNNNLAWELIMSEDESLRDYKAALTYAQRANELKPDMYATLDTLALAYFNNNDVKKAIEVERKAMELLPQDLPQEARNAYLQHLTQFEFAKPPDP